MKILNHFGINYTVIHDVDSPLTSRKGNLIKNAMWTINEKIFNESGIEHGCRNMIIANMPDFEFQYFEYLQSGDKPYNALCELRNPEFMATPKYTELINIFEYISSREHIRSITSFDDYYLLLGEYVETQSPEPQAHWRLEEAEKAYREASVTKVEDDR